MGASPERQVEISSGSVFGGRENKKDESRPLAATAVPVTLSEGSERVGEMAETPVDRYVKFPPAGGDRELGKCSAVLSSQAATILAWLSRSFVTRCPRLQQLTAPQASFPSVS